MMLENFGEVGLDGSVVPCVVFLVESCSTAVENMVYCTRSSVAEGAARIILDFPPVDIDWSCKAVNSCSNHETFVQLGEKT